MKFWIVQDGELMPGIDGNTRPWRASMLCSALAVSGHEVVWWSSTFSHVTKKHRFDGPRTMSVEPGVTMRLLHGPGYPSNKSFHRWLHYRAVAAAFRRESDDWPRPDLVFASLPSLELAEQGVAYSCRNGVPVLVDIRDLWPDHYLTMAPRFARGLLRLALFTEFARAERTLRRATGVVAISPAYLNWGLRLAGRSQRAADGVFPMGYPGLGAGQDTAVASRRQELVVQYGLSAARLIITFVGTFTPSFDLETVIEAARALHEAGNTGIRFMLVGEGEQGVRLRRQAADLPNVTFTGWCDHASVAAILGLSSLGLAPYRADTLISLPNKPYEYMAAGLPILSSLRGELERLLAEEGNGLQYTAGDAAGLVERALWLADHPDDMARMGAKSLELFTRRFRAEVVYPSLAKHLEQVAAG
jgi:glycosyltransferase involved in cell wall biosynthesis